MSDFTAHADLAVTSSVDYAGLTGSTPITIGPSRHIDRATARRLRSISRAERNRLAAGHRPRALTAHQQDVVDRAAGMPRGVSVGVAYHITRIDENRITLS